MNTRNLEILQHSLGVDQYGCGERYRNYFVTGPRGSDFEACVQLCNQGLMRDTGPRDVNGGMHTFLVTDAGVTHVIRESPQPPKLTRGQKRYREFMEADSDLTFGEWLKRQRELT